MNKIIVVLVLALATLASSAHAEFKWQHFGADPYAATRAEAMQKREAAFRAMGLPAPVIKQFMRATEKPGEKVRLVVGDRLTTMMSKGGRVHRDVVVAFVKPPVSGKMEYAAPAEKWQVTWEGKVYIVILPEICYNWSSIAGPPIKKCVELVFNAPISGHVRWGIGTTIGPIPPDECNAQRQDDMQWTSWYGECDICIPATGYIRGILGGSALVPHKYLYPVTTKKQTLRFSTEIWTKLVYICLEDVNGKQTCGVYMRPQDWKGQYRVEIPDSLWFWDDGNCPE